MKRLQDRVAVVAGAGPGIGRAIAVLFAQEGARVAVAARTAARVEETARMCQRAGGEAIAIPTDLTREEQVRALYDQTEKKYGAIHIVVNSAGGFYKAAVDRTPPAKLDEMVALNLRSVYLTTHLAIPRLEKQGGGAILNVSAAYGGHFPVTDLTAYNATKAAVRAFGESAAADLVGKNIRVNTLLPGIVSHEYEPGREWRTLRKLGGRVGTPEDCAHAALYLVSDEAGWVTGAGLLVDGGLWVNRKSL
ncbi:MAG: SDR family oxidoreductase [Euryarchaeota archaeon]|nr:SDR family oxidoreductase [Euryarchaeota archaeon]